jgi:hypothetical protein
VCGPAPVDGHHLMLAACWVQSWRMLWPTSTRMVSHSCACNGSPCLRHCVHGASIGEGKVTFSEFRGWWLEYTSTLGSDDDDDEEEPRDTEKQQRLLAETILVRSDSSSSVSQNGWLLSRRGRTLPANASGVDTHRASISSRCGQVSSPTGAAAAAASAAEQARRDAQSAALAEELEAEAEVR